MLNRIEYSYILEDRMCSNLGPSSEQPVIVNLVRLQ